MSEARRVRHLRLRAATPALVQRGALLLEDALRTASMPDPGRGRVLFIRQLALGVIRPDRSSSSLALALEQRVRALARDAVHAEEEGAAGADAVWFADAVQALVGFAARVERPGTLGAWFWPLVVPEAWGRPAEEAMRAVLAAAMELEEGPAAAVAVVEGLVARGAAGGLVRALRWSDGPRLARAFWGYAPAVDRGVVLAGAPSEELEALPREARAVVEAAVGGWGAEDVRSVWLAAVAISMRRPALVVEAGVPARAMRVVAAAAAAVARKARAVEAEAAKVVPLVRRPEVGSEEVPTRRDAEETAEAPRPGRPPETIAEARVPPARRDEEVREAAAAPEQVAERAPSSEQEWPETPEPTRAGGLLFLVHALGYLGFEELLAAQPQLRERAVAEHFLAWVAARLGVPARDPVLRALRAWELPPLAAPCPFEVPARVRGRMGAREPTRADRLDDGREVERDARGRLILAVRRARDEQAPTSPSSYSVPAGVDASDSSARGAHPARDGAFARSADSMRALSRSSDLQLLLRTLHLSVSRLLRTRARLSLRELVLRPARVSATPTHLDLLFDHSLTDLRIRRAGLDIDPGWVPWLGRVIRYHYLHGELPQA